MMLLHGYVDNCIVCALMIRVNDGVEPTRKQQRVGPASKEHKRTHAYIKNEIRVHNGTDSIQSQ